MSGAAPVVHDRGVIGNPLASAVNMHNGRWTIALAVPSIDRFGVRSAWTWLVAVVDDFGELVVVPR
jgi:hypothetical protein